MYTKYPALRPRMHMSANRKKVHFINKYDIVHKINIITFV